MTIIETLQKATTLLSEGVCGDSDFPFPSEEKQITISIPNTPLIRFLKKRGLLFKFLHNLYKSYGNITCQMLPDASNDLSNSFTWSETPEGHTFWSELHVEFEKIP